MKERPAFTHTMLREVMALIGLTTTGGVCWGSANMVKEAIVFSQKNKLNEILDDIKNKTHENFNHPVHLFLKGIHDYQYYSPLHPTACFGANTSEMAIEPTNVTLHAYKKQTLGLFLIELAQRLEKANLKDPVAILIEIDNHASCLGYTPEEKAWSYWDVTNMALIEVDSPIKSVTLRNHIADSYTLIDCGAPDPAIFKFYTTYHNDPILNEIINQWEGDELAAAFRIDRDILLAKTTKGDISFLVLAIKNKKCNKLAALIAAGADIHGLYYYTFLNNEKTTLLKIAIQEKNIKAVHELIRSGIDVNQTLKDGNTVLSGLSGQKDELSLNILAALLDAGAKVHDEFHSAAISGNIDLIKVFLTKGMNINKTDSMGETALSYACRFQRMSLIKYLLEQGANVNSKNNQNQRPIDFALKKNNLELVNLLFSYGLISEEKEVLHPQSLYATKFVFMPHSPSNLITSTIEPLIKDKPNF